MTNHVDRFRAALTVLAGHGHIKQRLMKAYEDNLDEIQDDELPIVSQQLFADLRKELHQVTPLKGESPICASVRKMSPTEASECAAMVVQLFSDLVTMSDEQVMSPAINDAEEVRVPPFLVKTV